MKYYRMCWEYMEIHDNCVFLENTLFSSVEELKKVAREYIYDYNKVRLEWEEWYNEDDSTDLLFDEWVEDTLEYVLSWEELEVWGA